jgi:hypothetical protein
MGVAGEGQRVQLCWARASSVSREVASSRDAKETDDSPSG